jgi:hypothetical protein
MYLPATAYSDRNVFYYASRGAVLQVAGGLAVQGKINLSVNGGVKYANFAPYVCTLLDL